MNPIIGLQTFLDQYLDGKTEVKVLEAGCGSASHLRFTEDCCLVGIDISEKQLLRNSLLHQKILGDIQYYNFQPETFDVIVCWDVLEHLLKPDLALNQFAKAIKKDGIIVLASPNLLSLKGLLTRYSPHWFHILFYQLAYGEQEAGQNDSGPFKTYLKPATTPVAIKHFARHRGLKMVYFHPYNLNLRRRNTIIHTTYHLLSRLLKTVSGGRLAESEYIMVLQK